MKIMALLTLTSIGQGALGVVTDCAVARFRCGVCLLSGRRQPVLPGVPGWVSAPTAPGWFCFRSVRYVAAGQVGAGRAQSRCQHVRNACFHGQSGLISRMRRRAWCTRRAGRCQTR